MNKIYGLKKADFQGNAESTVTCIDCEPEVTLRELQKYAHQHGLELPSRQILDWQPLEGHASLLQKIAVLENHQ